MKLKTKTFISILSATLIVISIAIFFTTRNYKGSTPTSFKSNTPREIFPYEAPKLPNKRSYRILLVGDSMTEALGINASLLREKLIERYPDKEFVTYNYSIPSSNILTLEERLYEERSYLGITHPPILRQGFDLIIIESFGYNPLSELPLDEGLKVHDEVLNDVIRKLAIEKPKSVIALMATIAPDRINLARNSRELSAKVREEWAVERIAYIKRHIEYADEKNLPLINVYEKSLLPNGEVNPIYISDYDYIHPSVDGVILISNIIAQYLYDEELIPINPKATP